MLIFFSIPVVITGLAELALYDMGTLVIGYYMASEFVGYYNASSPVARLPFIISMAVATSVLPATAEAMSLNNKELLKTYVLQSYRYVSLFVVIHSVLEQLYLLHQSYQYYLDRHTYQDLLLSRYLQQECFFSQSYTVSSSIAQGLGHPRLPMYVLIIGTTIDIILSIVLVPPFGINGAAIATTITSLFIMSTLVWKTLQLTSISLPIYGFWKNYYSFHYHGYCFHSISTN